MKKTFIPILFLFLAAVITIIYSCNKSSERTLHAQKEQQAKEKELITARIAKEGITRIIPLNKKIDYEYVDASGKAIPKELLSIRRSNKVTPDNTSACNFDNNFMTTIQSIAISSGCNTGYQMTWTYNVSTNNNIVQTNAYNSAYYTHGQLQVLDGTNAQVYYTDISPATLTDQGPDPARLGFELFSVVFSTTTALNASYFASPYTIKFAPFLATDCAPDANNNYQNLLYRLRAITPLANICDRIDPIQTANPSAPLRFYGEDPIGACPSTLTLPDMQEIQYSTNGGSTWVGGATASGTFSYYLPPPPGAPFTNYLGSNHYGYVDPYGALELQLTLPTGSYTVLVRYRNIHFNGALSSYPGNAWPIPNPGVNCCTGAWSIPLSYAVTY
jgi:hypothetical protein